MLKKLKLKCSTLLYFLLLFLGNQKVEAQNGGTRLKLLRQLKREHVGIGSTIGFRTLPKIANAIDFQAVNTIVPKKGYSLWSAEGNITVIMNYEPPSDVRPLKEIWLESLPKITGDVHIVVVMCCCETENNCTLEMKNGIIGKCIGLACCGQTISTINPAGVLKLYGENCNKK